MHAVQMNSDFNHFHGLIFCCMAYDEVSSDLDSTSVSLLPLELLVVAVTVGGFNKPEKEPALAEGAG